VLEARIIWHVVVAALCLAISGPAFAATGERIAVRAGEHPGFTRLVFDWPRKVDYDITVDDTAVTVTFRESATINLVPLKTADLNWIDAPDVEEAADRLVFTFRIAEGASVSHFRDGTKVVFDVLAPTGIGRVATSRPVNRAESPGPSVAQDVVNDAAAQEQKHVPGPPDRMMDRPHAREQKQPGPEVDGPQPIANQQGAAAMLPAEKPRSNAAGLRYSGAPVAVRSEPVFNGVRLTYPLADSLPAAVFQRAGYLWVIFDKFRVVDHAGLSAVAGKRILSIEQVPHPDATILRYRIAGGQHVVAHRRDNAWIVELKENLTAPKIPLEVGQHRYNGGPVVFIPVADVGSRVDITDPEVGDIITVVPVLAGGRGVAETRKFAQFNVLKSAQGVAIHILADDVLVERFRNGVAVTSSNGLAMSPDRHAPDFAGAPEAKAETRDTPQRLVDFAAWRRGQARDFNRVRHDFLHRLSLAPEEERNGVRWDLARFYLAHGMAARALGILQVMAATDPSLLDNPEFRAVRGVAYIQMRRFGEGRNDLAHKGLDAESDAYLWRAVAAAGLGQWEEALDNYMRGSDVLASYDEPERIRFEMTALKAGEKLGDVAVMRDQLKVLDGFLLPPGLHAEVEFLRARMLFLEGQEPMAMKTLAKVEEAGERPSAAQAALTRIKVQLRDDTIAKEDAIDQLERLRFAWRGDAFELDLLDLLGRLYIDTGNYHTGFNTLRQAITHFPKSPRTREISAMMAREFEKLFLDGRADALPPIEALALYYDFRELTPLGAGGDQMIRRLADRLVAVDLLERAAELLEHQVRYRLEGVAQAQVATRLAMIYLLDRKPEKALGVLRATRQTLMPEDVEIRRRHLEARALIDLERYEEAEVLLQGDDSADARMLRADLYWNAGQWKKVVANGEALLGRRWEVERPLTNDERRQVLRMAVAHSLDDNVEGLESLRQRYGALMAGGAYASAFNVITAQQDPSEREIKELTESIASVNTLESFMAAYRDEFSGS